MDKNLEHEKLENEILPNNVTTSNVFDSNNQMNPPLYVQSEYNLRESEIEQPINPILFIQSEPTLGDMDSETIYAQLIQQQQQQQQQPPLISNNEACRLMTPEIASVNLLEKSDTIIQEEENPQNSATTTQEAINLSTKRDCLRNQSELEVNAQHYKMQNQYKNQPRKRHLTDIDFEGILKLIGGCNTWQIIIYLMISAHQVPHAMFNLSVVYFTYTPDHWCKIPYFSREYIENPENTAEIGAGWTWEKALDSGIAFPKVKNTHRRGKLWHDQCRIYKISSVQYQEYLRMNFSDAKKLAISNSHVETQRCKEWDYDKSIMKDSVVSQWHRVCDDNWSRAHVHLSYSLGYLVGCILGGFISDRYGRKPAIYGFSILSTIFGFLLAFSREFEVFLIVRFLLAVCNEAADLAAYVYAMEITGVQYRSIVGSLLQAPWACGYAFLALVAYICKSWVDIQLITTILHFFALFLIHYVPESPRWLIVMNRVDEAEKIIRKACHFNKSSLPSDLGLVRHAEMRKWIKHNERPHFLHSFKSWDMTFRTIIIFIVWIATALVYYGCVIALSDQSSPGRSMFVGNFFLNNAIAGAIELPTLMSCVFLLKFGRKSSQMITLISAGTLIFIAMCASLMEEMTFSLIFMLAGKACIQGAFNILYIFTSELYPTVIRNSAVGTCSMVARIGAGASGYVAILSDVTLPTVPMAIFCIFSLFAGVLIYFLPETQNMPLPDTMWDAVTMLKNPGVYRCVGGIEEKDFHEMTNAANPNPPKNDIDENVELMRQNYDEDIVTYTNASKR